MCALFFFRGILPNPQNCEVMLLPSYCQLPLIGDAVGSLRAPIVGVPAMSGERKGRVWWWVIKVC